MKRRTLARWLCAAVACALLLVSPTTSADGIDDQARQIAKRLQCPVCEGVSVADSPSELATQMRNVIRRKLEQGEGEPEIIAYFVERYGDGVLVEPPRRGVSLAVWIGPLVALAGGAGMLAVLVRGWLRPRGAPARPLRRSPAGRNGTARPSTVDGTGGSYSERARRELDGFRRDE